ncbi:hypothetical protein [Streptomyces sp. NPDC052535]|uniref:hypothetical protein n=1 Tax=Streptomyces sp. NPDC052535 TaxID=3155531 RepID=UPI00341A4147
MGTAVLERAEVTVAPAQPSAPAGIGGSPGHDQALDAMLHAVRRMGIDATDRQVAALLSVAERHLLPPKRNDQPFPHGTMRGYRRHQRLRERACAPCREACRLESAARRKRHRRPEKPCGTEAAYHRHRRRYEEPCQPCRDAHAAYIRDYRERRAQAAAH